MEEKILDLFLFNKRLKFNEIKNLTGIRSNILAYHLKNMLKIGILENINGNYKISEDSEYLIPYLSNKNPVLAIILIHIGDSRKCFLIKRSKRPFKDSLSLPGGRILLGESIKDSVKRLMKEKFNIDARLKKINSISLENLKKGEKIVHSYLLIFVTASAEKNIPLTDIVKDKKNIISSDLYLLKKDLNKSIDIRKIDTIKF